MEKKSWSLIGVGELEGTIQHEGRDLPVRVELIGRLPLSDAEECFITVAGERLTVRTVQ